MSLSQHLEAGDWVMLLFIPMAWSFICPTEVVAFNARLQEFETRSCAVVFASTDSEQVLRAWSYTSHEDGGLGGVHVPLLSDRNHRISRDYGVLIEEEGFAQRAMFIIDPQGVVRHFSCNDVEIGRSVDEARRVLDALIFTDEFGEGCPVDWKKGDQGLKLPSKPKNKVVAQARPDIKRMTSWKTGWIPQIGVQRPKTWTGPVPNIDMQSPTSGEVLFRAPSNAPTSDRGSITPGLESVHITNLDAMSNNWQAETIPEAIM